ncbi:hypothetical protein D1007_31494 [Hordeum vulgare]|nr:hypothetical protein D1007_31494 [Hordeum vulgare]
MAGLCSPRPPVSQPPDLVAIAIGATTKNGSGCWRPPSHLPSTSQDHPPLSTFLPIHISPHLQQGPRRRLWISTALPCLMLVPRDGSLAYLTKGTKSVASPHAQ